MYNLKQRTLFFLVFLNLISFALAAGSEGVASSVVGWVGMTVVLAGLKRKLHVPQEKSNKKEESVKKAHSRSSWRGWLYLPRSLW